MNIQMNEFHGIGICDKMPLIIDDICSFFINIFIKLMEFTSYNCVYD
jgi:hypothetical protein